MVHRDSIKVGPLRQSRSGGTRAGEERARRDIDDVFTGYWEWIEDTMTTEKTPWLKVICAMVGNG